MDPVPPQNTPPPLVARRSWWSRNWKWFVPTGCLTIIVAAAAFLAIIFFSVFALMKSTPVYKTALERAKSNPQVIEALGTPIKEGYVITGSTHTEGPGGEVNIGIPISGPKGKGTIYVVADKVANRWTYRTFEVEVDGRPDRIALLPNSAEP